MGREWFFPTVCLDTPWREDDRKSPLEDCFQFLAFHAEWCVVLARFLLHQIGCSEGYPTEVPQLNRHGERRWKPGANTRFTLRQIFAEAFGIVDSLFSRRVRIQMCTEIFHFQFQFSLTSLVRALNERWIILISTCCVAVTLKAICSRK